MMRSAIRSSLLAAAGSALIGPAAQALESGNGRGLVRSEVTVASASGAALDSDLHKGGGTDDTQVLQSILDRAERGTHVHLVVDGPALISGLQVHSNTTVECRAGGGFYLKDEAKRAIIRNAHRSRDAVRDENITIRGCFFNGNRAHQTIGTERRPDLAGAIIKSPKEADGTFISGLQFFGVRNLVIENVSMYGTLAFGIWVGNAHDVTVQRVRIDRGDGPLSGMTDGLFFSGPIRFLNLDNIAIRTGDDAICLCANHNETNDVTRRNDFGPYVGQGPITDVTISNVQLRETTHGIRLLSSDQRVDRISISNVTGIVTNVYVFTIGHWTNPKSFGNYGSVSISNVNVDRGPTPPEIAASLKDPKWGRDLSKEWNEGRIPFLQVNSPIEVLSLRNIVTKVMNDEPVLRFGPDARVGQASVDLVVHDAGGRAVPIELDAGATVHRMDLELGWTPPAGHPTGKAIISAGDAVGTLNWINRPADQVTK